MPSLLFVCTANICRSPMAEALFKRKLEEAALSGEWRVESAGTWARRGEPAAEKARMLLGKQGLDLERHRSKTVTGDLLRAFDLILVMETGHKEAMQAEFPEHAGQIYLLSEMVGERRSINDPIGGSFEDFSATIRELNTILEQGFPEIERLANQGAQERGKRG